MRLLKKNLERSIKYSIELDDKELITIQNALKYRAVWCDAQELIETKRFILNLDDSINTMLAAASE